jgi:hypothetical protein
MGAWVKNSGPTTATPRAHAIVAKENERVKGAIFGEKGSINRRAIRGSGGVVAEDRCSGE